MKSHRLITKRTAHYFTIGDEESKNVWIVLHGIGQLADDFIKPFNIIKENNLIISVEGLSTYYTDDAYEKVGASWMTRRFSQDEIQDQIVLLNNLIKIIYDSTKCYHLLGFSQGVATALRWLVYENPPISSFIAWAGSPPELKLTDAQNSYLKGLNSFYVYGTSDPFINIDKIDMIQSREDVQSFNFDIFTFNGGHHLNRKTLEKLDEIIRKP